MKPQRLAIFVTAVALIAWIAASWRSGASAEGQLDRRADDGVAGIGSITWGTCSDETLAEFGAECGFLSVPRDYSRPTGPKVKLALSRIRHTVPDDQYQGIMLVNPGGPGASGLIFAILGVFVPNGVGAAYDWIGFDPRGVGASLPSLHCSPTYSAGPRPPYDPVTRHIEVAWLSRVTTYADDCARAGTRLLDHVKTIDSVRDMNAIRVALGASQINYYGYSYGTYLGQVFATQYPTRVRRMVLDSNVDPRRVWYDANLDQDIGFETVLIAGYLQASWPDVAAGFAAYVHDDDPGPALDLFHASVDTTDDNGYAMYLATECTEGFWPSMWSVWRRDNSRIAREAPYLTWGNAWYNAPCAFWPAESSSPIEVRDHKVPPILLLGETLDAATPFRGSVEVRDRFQASSLIATKGGTTHANSLFGGNACVDDRVAAYLADGSAPKRVHGAGPDVVCPATPEPVPVDAATAVHTQALSADAKRRLQAKMFRR